MININICDVWFSYIVLNYHVCEIVHMRAKLFVTDCEAGSWLSASHPNHRDPFFNVILQ